jgi:phosphoserine aminotransferase
MRKHNFGAGPGILPEEAVRKTGEALFDFNGSGMGVMEISHRSKEFAAVMERANGLVRELLGVPDTHEVLFLQGGASGQFAMVPMNFLNKKAAYVDAGAWSAKAIKEARNLGEVSVVASSKDKNYLYMPKGFDIPVDCDYLHITSNETIHGTQVKKFPDSKIPVVCDMSSDIFSRPVDVSRFHLIYAGAQKNMGPAGVTLVILRKDWAAAISKKPPVIFNYNTHIENGSLYNTPPVISILVCMYTLEWLKALGGVGAMEKINAAKASLFYGEVDNNPLFTGTAAKEDRSPMNGCFLLKDPSLDADFLQAAKDAGIVGIKGHRSVGGFRASMYNALPLESVKALTEVMSEFAKVKA